MTAEPRQILSQSAGGPAFVASAVRVKLISDALSGEAVAMEFLQANMPRHIQVVFALLVRSQKEGSLTRTPLSQAPAFLIGSVGAPILLHGTSITNGFVPPIFVNQIEQNVLSDAAIAERVDMALTGLATGKKREKSGVKK
jgi:hypothetical protein